MAKACTQRSAKSGANVKIYFSNSWFRQFAVIELFRTTAGCSCKHCPTPSFNNQDTKLNGTAQG